MSAESCQRNCSRSHYLGSGCDSWPKKHAIAQIFLSVTLDHLLPSADFARLRPKGSSLVDHRGFVQCFQLGGWLEEVPPRQNRCILQQLAERRLADWPPSCHLFLKEIHHQNCRWQLAGFLGIIWGTDWWGDSTKTWKKSTAWGNHQGIAAGKLRRRRLEDILKWVMTEDGGNFKFWNVLKPVRR